MIACPKLLSAYLRDTRGASILEFAFVVPALFLLLFGIIEYGIIFHLRSLATLAGNEAARMGKTGQFTGSAEEQQEQVVQKVCDVMSAWITDCSSASLSDTLTVGRESFGTFTDVTPGGGGAGGGVGGQVVLYTVTYYWRPAVPFLLSLATDADGKVPIRARALVKNEAF